MSFGAVLAALAAVICFSYVFIRCGLIAVAENVSKVAVSGVTTMLDASLDDDAKERAVRKAGTELMRLSWRIAWRVALSLAAILPPILLADILGIAPSERSFGTLLRVDFIVLVSVIAIATGWVWRKRSRSKQNATLARISGSDAYNSGDRLMHAVAFSGPKLQKALARFDDRLHRSAIERVNDAPPIFITSLARGGTTALLNALHDHPDIATHRYIDMPFLSAPLLWNRLAGGRTDVATRERAHGDGIRIGLQSPEAFDEVFWMLHWPEKYRQDRIDLWNSGDFKSEARDFFLRHFRKIAILRRLAAQTTTEGGAQPVRYLSKNNANIARLTLLPTLFPGCKIVVPLREPSAHAASLYRQHQNFKKLHAEDAFSKQYMRDIGHFEFGELHRPIAFDMERIAGRSADQPDYWLAYWIACFENIATNVDAITLVAQDRLRADAHGIMDAVLTDLSLSRLPSARWEDVILTKPDRAMDDLFDSALLAKARAIYASLHDRSLGQ